MAKKKDPLRKYVDGGEMKRFENLLEGRKFLDEEKEVRTKKLKAAKAKGKSFKKMSSSDDKNAQEGKDPIYFNGKMRKTFVEGVLQDIKGYFEYETSNSVEIAYQDYVLKDHEFGFKMTVKKSRSCSKQLWSEVSSAVVNVVSYMFPSSSFDEVHLDLAISQVPNMLEFEIVSCW